MKDFIIMSRKSTRQLREILEWPTGEEPQLRSILLGALKGAFTLKSFNTDGGTVNIYAVSFNRPIKHVMVTIRVSHDRMSPDGTQRCAFVTNIVDSKELQT